jgi:uncharacterized protein YecE (DUF72 family)
VVVRIGTSGYSYKEWKGTFYPARFPADQMLRFYAERFDAVEINATFYRMPTEKVLLGWAAQVPAGFTFVLKAPRRITHEQRLAGADESVGVFLKASSVLGPRLGPSLFQLPPNFRKDLGRLRGFLSLVPRTWRAAFEFRHASWFDDEVFGALRDHNAALCINDMGEGEVNAPFVATADWGYLRLRRVEYPPGLLERWADQLLGQPWNTAYVFFKHEEEATGPRLAAELKALVRPEG